MHLHKINFTSQEHQNFLAQNRKDPITGDLIAAGDEVVFCASCKSVFLRDTWEYLGKQHCEQENTLKIFPTFSKLDLTTKENIFFYTYLYTNSKGQSYIPNLYSEWKIKKRELSEYHYFFNGAPIYLISIFIFLVGGGIAYITQTFFPFIIGILFTIICILSSEWHNAKHSKKLETIHKNFKNNVFFFSTKGIGFSSTYGIKEYILDACHIESLEFNFATNIFLAPYCVINYIDKHKTKFDINDFFKQNKEDEFLKALDRFNSMFSIPIHLKVNSNACYQRAIDFINSTPNNITIQIK